MLSPSVLNSTLVPRNWRICFLLRLIMPWRLPDWAYITFPVPVTLKRFLAPDLVLILGIWLSLAAKPPLYPPSLAGEDRDGVGPKMRVNERCHRRHGSPNQPGGGGARLWQRRPKMANAGRL